MRGFHRLADVDEKHSPPVPEEVVLTEVCVNQVALLVHPPHALNNLQVLYMIDIHISYHEGMGNTVEPPNVHIGGKALCIERLTSLWRLREMCLYSK